MDAFGRVDFDIFLLQKLGIRTINTTGNTRAESPRLLPLAFCNVYFCSLFEWVTITLLGMFSSLQDDAISQNRIRIVFFVLFLQLLFFRKVHVNRIRVAFYRNNTEFSLYT